MRVISARYDVVDRDFGVQRFYRIAAGKREGLAFCCSSAYVIPGIYTDPEWVIHWDDGEYERFPRPESDTDFQPKELHHQELLRAIRKYDER